MEVDPPVAVDGEIPDIEDGIDEADLPKDFLTPFRHGFHREVVTGTREEQKKIYYTTPDGTRVGTRKALNPYLEVFEDIGQENFTFLPITLQIKDP